jgi:hypothetical protein
MANLSYDRLIKAVKTAPDASQSDYAKKLGITVGQLPMLILCKAKVDAGVAKKAPATPKSVRTLRDQQSERWEMVAARTGVSVTKAKDLYEQAGGDPKNSYLGRGRNFGNGPSPKKKSTAKAKAKTSGKASTKRTGGSKRGQIVRRRTRAGGNNPS